MQVTETNAEGLRREYMVVVEANDIETEVQRKLGDLARDVRLPGFRPGKVPLKLLRKRFGGSIMGEVLEHVVGDSSVAAMRERNLRPALQPKIEIVSFNEGTDLAYRMAVEILPEVQPMSFSELTLERLKPEIPDSDIDSALESIARQQRKSDVVDRPAENGDIVMIDFVGRVDGTEFPGGKAESYSLELGSDSFIPGFEAQLVGATADEERIVTVTFPEDYGAEDLAGKAAEFTVTVKEVKGLAPQPIDQSLAEAVGMENLEALRDAVRERLLRDYTDISRQRLKRDLLDRLAERHSFEVPQGMVDIEFNNIWQQFEVERNRLRETAAKDDGPEAISAKAALDDDGGKSDDELKGEYRAIAERRVRLGLLLAEVGRSNNITVSPDELNRALTEVARRYPGQERQVIEAYRGNPAAVDELRAPIYEDKVVDFILELAQITDRVLPASELMAAVGEDTNLPAPPSE